MLHRSVRHGRGRHELLPQRPRERIGRIARPVGHHGVGGPHDGNSCHREHQRRRGVHPVSEAGPDLHRDPGEDELHVQPRELERHDPGHVHGSGRELLRGPQAHRGVQRYGQGRKAGHLHSGRGRGRGHHRDHRTGRTRGDRPRDRQLHHNRGLSDRPGREPRIHDALRRSRRGVHQELHDPRRAHRADLRRGPQQPGQPERQDDHRDPHIGRIRGDRADDQRLRHADADGGHVLRHQLRHAHGIRRGCQLPPDPAGGPELHPHVRPL